MSTSSEEVRYHLLRPDQIVARRKACPVAWLPIGTIEWHGVHNPLGADALQAEELSIRCARRLGGLAFPPLYYGESRLTALMEANAADRDAIAEKMALSAENFTAAHQPFSATEQSLNYQRLLIHILAELETLGFEVGVIVAGHYPLIDHARAATMQHQQLPGDMIAWAFVDYELVADQYDCAGDHAGGWETSHLMASHPETVDLTRLPPKGEKAVGAGGRLAPQDATGAFGSEIFDAAAEVACREVGHRVENPDQYRGHGGSLLRGLWKTD